MEREHMPVRRVQRGTWSIWQSRQLEGASAFDELASVPASLLRCTSERHNTVSTTASWLLKWDTRLAQGASLHLLCGRPFTSQPELGSGWESLHKRSRGALLEALLS